MAVVEQTRYVYTGDGVTREFPIVFQYLRDSDVVVQVGGQDVAYTFSQGNSFVRLADVPSAGATVVVQRSTEARNPLHEFQHGSPLVPGYLDENFKQVLYTVSEAASDTAAAFAAAGAAEQAALGAEQAAVAAQLVATTATQEAAQGIAAAQAAQTTADTALNEAGLANAKADLANDKADASNNIAGGAALNSNTAMLEATRARIAAEAALQQIEDAVAGSVTSFNGRTGAVVPSVGDYSVGDITGLPEALGGVPTVTSEVGDSTALAASQKLVTDLTGVLEMPSPFNIDTSAGNWRYRKGRYPTGVSGTFPWGSASGRGCIVAQYVPPGYPSESVQILHITDAPGQTEDPRYMVGGTSVRYGNPLTGIWSSWFSTLTTYQSLSTPLSGSAADTATTWSRYYQPTARSVRASISASNPISLYNANTSRNSVDRFSWNIYSGVASAYAATANRAFKNITPVALEIRAFLGGPGVYGYGVTFPASNNLADYFGIEYGNLLASQQYTMRITVQPGQAFNYTFPITPLIVIINYTTNPRGDFPADPFEMITLT